MIQSNVSLKEYNSFKCDYKAKYLSIINDAQQLKILLGNELFKTLPKLILGNGTNILLTKDFDGIVLINQLVGIDILRTTADNVWLQVGSGEDWHKFVLFTIENNLYGIQNLAFIPGTVGAAPIQNIGAYGCEIMDVLHKITYLDLETLDEVSLYNKDCMFSYRNSIFKKELKNKCFILNCVFELSRKISFNTKYSDIHNELIKQKINENDLNPMLFVNIIGQIRERKFPNLKKTGNAGSFFKNPLITSSQLKILLDTQCSSMPFYETDLDGIYKLSAGWLIDRAGWKGISMGSCGVYENHALILVNNDFLADGQQILQLSKKIKESVRSIFNIDLEEEVDIF